MNIVDRFIEKHPTLAAVIGVSTGVLIMSGVLGSFLYIIGQIIQRAEA